LVLPVYSSLRFSIIIYLFLKNEWYICEWVDLWKKPPLEGRWPVRAGGVLL